jgi:hypothetical protein
LFACVRFVDFAVQFALHVRDFRSKSLLRSLLLLELIVD